MYMHYVCTLVIVNIQCIVKKTCTVCVYTFYICVLVCIGCSREHINPSECGCFGRWNGWSGTSTQLSRGICSIYLACPVVLCVCVCVCVQMFDNYVMTLGSWMA